MSNLIEIAQIPQVDLLQPIDSKEIKGYSSTWTQLAAIVINPLAILALFLNPRHELDVSQEFKDWLGSQGFDKNVRFYSSKAVPALIRARFTKQASAIGCRDYDLIPGGPFVIIGKELPKESMGFILKHEIAHIKHNDLAKRIGFVFGIIAATTIGFSIAKTVGILAFIIGSQLFKENSKQAESAADLLALQNSSISELKKAITFFDSFDEAFKRLESSHPSIISRIEKIEQEIEKRVSQVVSNDSTV